MGAACCGVVGAVWGYDRVVGSPLWRNEAHLRFEEAQGQGADQPEGRGRRLTTFLGPSDRKGGLVIPREALTAWSPPNKPFVEILWG